MSLLSWVHLSFLKLHFWRICQSLSTFLCCWDNEPSMWQGLHVTFPSLSFPELCKFHTGRHRWSAGRRFPKHLGADCHSLQSKPTALVIRMWGLGSVFASTGNEDENHKRRAATILTMFYQKNNNKSVAYLETQPQLLHFSTFMPASIRFFPTGSQRCASACLVAGLCLSRLFYLLALLTLTRRSFPTHSLYLLLPVSTTQHCVLL